MFTSPLELHNFVLYVSCGFCNTLGAAGYLPSVGSSISNAGIQSADRDVPFAVWNRLVMLHNCHFVTSKDAKSNVFPSSVDIAPVTDCHAYPLSLNPPKR